MIRFPKYFKLLLNNLTSDITLQFTNFYSWLFFSIAVPDCDHTVFQRIKVYSDAKRRTNFILTIITLTNVTPIIPSHAKIFAQTIINFFSLSNQFRLIL